MNEFELFKSNVCQMIKNKDSQIVINEIIRRNLIDEYFDNEEYDKALYLVAMINIYVELFLKKQLKSTNTKALRYQNLFIQLVLNLSLD